MSPPSFESHRRACSEWAYLIYGDLGVSVRQEFEIVGRGTHGAIDNLLYQILVEGTYITLLFWNILT